MGRKTTAPNQIKCNLCNYTSARTYRLREHYQEHHPDAHPYDLEYSITKQKNPRLDIDLLIVRYLDRQENLIDLRKQGIFVDHFLRSIGVARTDREDKSIMSRAKWKAASDARKFDAWLKRDLTILKNKGFEELSDAVTTLRLIKYTKKQIEKALAPETEKEPEERLIGAYTILDE